MNTDLVVFKLDDMILAVAAQQVREVCRLNDYAIYPMPKAPGFCLGLIQLRGEMMPLVTIEPWVRGQMGAFDLPTDIQRDEQRDQQRDRQRDILIVNSQFGPVAIPVQHIICHQTFQVIERELQTEYIIVLPLDTVFQEVGVWQN